MTPLVEKRFRANPRYELLLREHCPDDAARPTLPSGEPLYGYLEPKPSAQLPRRAISPETALLFLTLRHDGPVPPYFRSLFGDRTTNHLARLVLDGVLEVEHEKNFISGPDATATVIGDESYSGAGPLANLSIEAIRYGEALGDLTLPEMRGRLYGFGRRPVTPALKRKFERGEIACCDGLSGSAPPFVDRYWMPAASANAHWIMWRPTKNNADDERARFKLYVSPGCSHLADAFAASAEVLGQNVGIRGLKLGRGLAGLTRPDKLVAYFSRFDDLQAAGADLCRRLEGYPVHGVPFTAELSPDGLLSWGADRPRAVPGQPESWRFWVASKLAAHLETARKAGVSGPLWRFVLDRLRLDGVNPDVWAPTDDFWSSLPPPT